MANNQAKKSIIIFSTAYLPLVGGAEMAVKEITDRLPNYHFDLITARIQLDLDKFGKIGNLNVYRLGLGAKLDKFLLPFLGLWKAIQLEKKNHYSLIWSIMASQAGLTAVFFKFFYPNKNILLNIQEGDPEEHLKRYAGGFNFLYKMFIRPWHLLSFKKADYLTAISRDLKKRAIESGTNCPIEIVPNGVDLNKFQITNHKLQITNFKQELGIKKDEKVIITASRLVKKNAMDDLIKAGQYLNSPFKILILGSGPDEGKLKKLTEDLNLKEKVIFLGYVPNKDLPKYFAVANVFVRPSLSEGLGNSFLEAMAAGLPVIGTSVGGIPDFLVDKETGLFCQVNNSKDLAEKIKEILTDDQLREKIIANGQKLVQEKYNWDGIAKQMDNIFQRII